MGETAENKKCTKRVYNIHKPCALVNPRREFTLSWYILCKVRSSLNIVTLYVITPYLSIGKVRVGFLCLFGQLSLHILNGLIPIQHNPLNNKYLDKDNPYSWASNAIFFFISLGILIDTVSLNLTFVSGI
jgi:hypothetical protein